MDKSYKKYFMPILAVALCIMMIATCLVAAYAVDKRFDNTHIQAPNPIQPDTSNSANALDLPSDHDVRKVDAGSQTAVGMVPKNYNNKDLVNPVEISNKHQLRAWLLSKDNAGRDAKLVADIGFDWAQDYNTGVTGVPGGVDESGKLMLFDGTSITLAGAYYHSSSRGDTNNVYSIITEDRILDGCGYSITYNGIDNNEKDISQDVSFFAREILGTVQNITFKVPGGKTFSTTNSDGGLEFRVGFLCVYMRENAVMNNVKVDFAAVFGKQNGDASSVISGIIAAQIAGTLNYCEVNVSGAARFKADADTQAMMGMYGGRGFIGAQGARLNNCSLNFNNLPLRPTFNQLWLKDKSAIAAGIFADGSNSNVNGFITKNADVAWESSDASSSVKWYNFFGTTNDNTVAKNLYLLNNDTNKPVNETKFAIVRIKPQLDFSLEWDKSIDGRIVIRSRLYDDANIYWNITQENGKSYTDLYRYGLKSNTLLSIPAYSPADKPVGGALMAISRGEIGNRDSMQFTSSGITTTVDSLKPNYKINTAIYTARAHIVTATFKSALGQNWNDNNSYAIKYNGKIDKPVIPGIYITTIESKATDPKDVELFAYFDETNRRIVFRDDTFTSNNFTLNITMGETDILSKVVNGIDYIDNTWTNKYITVTTQVKGINVADPIPTRPNIVKLTFDDKEEQSEGKQIEWIDSYRVLFDGNLFIEYDLSISCSDKPIRFALFRDDIQLTTISDVSIFSQVDLTPPAFELDEASHRGANPLRDLNKWFDRYNADGNSDDNAEVSQIWIRTLAGTSGVNVSTRGRKMNSDGTFGEWGAWGMQAYQPLSDGSIIDPNVYAQRFYDDKKTREQNVEQFNGTWEIGIKVVNGAGIIAKVKGTEDEEITVTVKVDYNNYNLDPNTIARVWHGSDMNDSILQTFSNDVCDIKIKYNGERNYFFRNEPMKYDIVVKEVIGGEAYSLATANGIDVPKANRFSYTATYSHSSTLPIGTQPNISVGLKKLVKGNTAAVADQEYGNTPPQINDKVSLNEVVYDGITLRYTFTPTITDSKGVDVGLINKKLPIGMYNIAVAASVNTGDTLFDNKCNTMYDLDVIGTTYNVTHKRITLEYDKATLSSSLRNFTSRWIKFADFSSQIVDGDVVVVTSVYPQVPPTEEDLVDGLFITECFAKLNNANYLVTNTCQVSLANFVTDTEDSTTYLLETPEDIVAIKDNFLNAKFKLRNDIDFKSKATNGLGNFGGSFDGNGYAIKNLKILSNNSLVGGVLNIGLFASLTDGASIKNLVLSNMIVDVKASAATTVNVGALAGVASNASINNVSIQGSIYATGAHKNTSAGVLLGKADKMTIRNVMTVATIYFVNNITNIDKQVITGGGVAGVLTNSNLSKVSAINQGYINTSVDKGAGYIAGVQKDNVIATDVLYLKDSILNSGVTLTSDAARGKVYANFLNDTTKFGQLTSTMRGGVSFSDIMTKLIPLNMRKNGLTRLEVSTHRELIILLNYNFADYKIMKDIYCFDGFNYSGTYKFAGNIQNENGYKVYANNQVFDIGNK